MRTGRQHFATLTDIAHPGATARLDVHEARPGELVVVTDEVAAFRLDPRPDATRLVVDGQALEAPAGAPIELRRTGDRWRPGRADPPRGHKRAGLEGALRDVFLDPVVFVHGSRNPATARANREVAEHFATRYTGTARYPVLADDAARPDALAGKHVFLVGTPEDNRLLGAIAARLPITVRDGAVHAGRRRHAGPGVGALFIHPNPDQPTRYVVVLTAPAPGGIWRALSLPNLLPDFVVYDDALAPATASQVLGDGRVLDAGFFGRDWSLPP
jgi:hypothetical protein